MEELQKQSWYFGEIDDYVAASALNDNGGTSTFVVYKNPQTETLKIIIRRNKGDDGSETRVIRCAEGSYQIADEPGVHPDVVTAVTHFAQSHNLMPAFATDGAATALLGSNTDMPPSYSQVDKALHPEFAPLPELESEVIPEAHYEDKDLGLPGSHKHYYRNLHRCHPKNVCHYCWYSDGDTWVYPNNKGPLRAACVVIMWILLITFCCPCACPIAVFLKLMHHVNFC